MNTPTHAIKRQQLQTTQQLRPSPTLFDNPTTWLSSPELAYSSWLATQAYADSTKTVYAAMFSNFCRWLKDHGKRLDQTEKGDIARFLDTINTTLPKSRQHLQKGRQRQQYVRQIERVFIHLGSLGIGSTNPGREAGYAKVGAGTDKATRFLSRAERATVIAAVQEGLDRLRKEKKGSGGWMEYRDLALVSTMMGAGLKINHLQRLTLNCIDRREQRIDLSSVGYTHRARILGVFDQALYAWLDMQAQLHEVPPNPKTHPVFEAERRGFALTSKTLVMHATSMHRRTQRFLELAGITGDRASAQTLRNTYAAQLIDADASDDELVDFLGLKANLTAKRLRAAYTFFCSTPLA